MEVSLLWRVGFRFLHCFLYLLSFHPSILMFLLCISVCRLLVTSIPKLFMNLGACFLSKHCWVEFQLSLVS